MLTPDQALSVLARDPQAPLDLAEVALGLARDEYSSLDVEGYLSELTAMARDLRPSLTGSLESRLSSLCRYLFHDLGFRGNVQHYYDPRNSYLNQVLDRRTGLPITLSLVCLAVGRRAGLEVAGVGLPGHFIAKVTDSGSELLFDPFHGGRWLTAEECELLVEQRTGQPFHATPEALAAVSPAAFVLRMLTNLKAVYLQQGDFRRAARVIGRLRGLAPDDPIQQRDLGVALFQAGQVGKAIDPLAAYLDQAPEADDFDAVFHLLRQARGQVAQWN